MLTINNANGVTLGGNQTINTNLTLTSGRITLGNNSLLLGTSATLTGGTAANYCVTNGTGTMRRRVPNTATNVLYPVGLATSYLPVNVQLTAGSTADDFSVRVETGVSSSYDIAGTPTGTPLTAHSTQATWHINEVVATGSNATVQVQWNIGQEGTGFTRTSSTVARYTGSAWEFGSFAAATGGDPYTRSRAGITNFSPFTVSDNVDSDTDGTLTSLTCARTMLTRSHRASAAVAWPIRTPMRTARPTASTVAHSQWTASSTSMGTPVPALWGTMPPSPTWVATM